MRKTLCATISVTLISLAACELSVVGTKNVTAEVDSGVTNLDASTGSDARSSDAQAQDGGDAAVTPTAVVGEYGVGNGNAGDFNANTALAGALQLNQYAALTTNLAATATTLQISQVSLDGWNDLSKFANGTLVLIWSPIANTTTDATRALLTSGGAIPIDLPSIEGGPGKFVFRRVLAVSEAVSNRRTLTVDGALGVDFDNATTQVISVPEFNNVELSSFRVLEALKYENGFGGFLGFFAKNTVNTGADSAVVASAQGAGFVGAVVRRASSACPWDGNAQDAVNLALRGGPSAGFALRGGSFVGPNSTSPKPDLAVLGGASYVANGGGGGACGDSGGGGGGHGSSGGQGGRSFNNMGGGVNAGGRGGAQVTYTLISGSEAQRRLMLGGGGGAGNANDDKLCANGGSGGGVIWIQANQISGSGSFLANGLSPGATGAAAGNPCSNGNGGSGGGAGGTLVLRTKTTLTCGSLTSISGGAGAGVPTDHGPGGGGGFGRAWLSASNRDSACKIIANPGLKGTAGTTQQARNATDGAREVTGTPPPVAVESGLP
jgi:large repetitive protein